MKKIVYCFCAICTALSSIGRAEYIEEDIDVIIQRANSGDAYYQAALGEIYYRGEQGEENFEKAFQWFTVSAEAGSPIALFNLGCMCIRGEYRPPDTLSSTDFFSGAFPGLQRLAEEGDARAQTALSSLYRYGWGTDENTELSLIWNTTAAEQGFPRAMYNEGIIYYTGMGVEKNYEKAKVWFERLAGMGDKKAMFQLANMYYNGHGYDRDTAKATEIFRKIQEPNRFYEGMTKEGDYIVPNILPPKYSLIIEEGSCGECCLWSILYSKGIAATQVDINKAGGDPGRGLHVDELYPVFDKYDIGFIELSKSTNTSDCALTAEKYRSFLYDDVIPGVRKGHPVLIGVKVFPTRFPDWAFDHFLLVVGYNERTDELIYNDFEKRKRIPAEQLVSQSEMGYSLVNKYNWVFAIEFPDLSH